MRLPLLLRRSTASVRSRLFRDLVLIFVLAVSVIAVSAYLQIRESRRQLAEAQIAQALILVREEMRRLSDPIENQLRIIRGWGLSKILPFADPVALADRLFPVLMQTPKAAAIVVADARGAERFLMSDGGDRLMRVRAPGDVQTVTWTRWRPGREDAEASWGEETDHDPRERPWHRGALRGGGTEDVYWSEPYVFHTLKVAGVTASIAWDSGEGTYVAAIDVTLETVLDSIGRLPLPSAGKAFLFRPDGAVYTTGGLEPAGSGDGFVSVSGDLGGSLAFDAIQGWDPHGDAAEEPFRFSSGGRDWWGGFAPLIAGERDGAWIEVAVPAAGISGVVRGQWTLLALTLGLVLVLGVSLASLVVRRYGRRIRELPTLAISRRDYENDLYRLINDGESEHLEFKSTMRMNLKSGVAGKEIELAWLKGVVAFLNTDGGILLLGVADDGTVLGLEPDGFENDDKCRLHFKNLLHQHVGPELSPHVRFELYRIDDKQIAAVECERANEPVFLRNKNQESFYIRNGPSNIELQVSRALKYVQGRF